MIPFGCYFSLDYRFAAGEECRNSDRLRMRLKGRIKVPQDYSGRKKIEIVTNKN